MSTSPDQELELHPLSRYVVVLPVYTDDYNRHDVIFSAGVYCASEDGALIEMQNLTATLPPSAGSIDASYLLRDEDWFWAEVELIDVFWKEEMEDIASE